MNDNFNEGSSLGLPEGKAIKFLLYTHKYLGWRMKESRSHPGTMYYINKLTGDVQWEIPTHTAGGTVVRKSHKTEEPKEVKVSHIVVKHKDSRRPSSWKEKVITRSKEEAIEIVKGLKKQLESVEEEELADRFDEFARVHSDCSSAKRGGDLGRFGKGKMQKNFELASFKLGIGELSDIVETASGIHVIYRIE